MGLKEKKTRGKTAFFSKNIFKVQTILMSILVTSSVS